MIGYGVALAVLPDDDNADEVQEADNADSESRGNDTENDGSSTIIRKNGTGSDPAMALIHKYVKIAVTIGFGLFLSLPSLASQIVWESVMPAITATDIAYDMGTESVLGIIPKWNTIIKRPKLPGLGGLIGGKVGGEGAATTVGVSGEQRSGG